MTSPLRLCSLPHAWFSHSPFSSAIPEIPPSPGLLRRFIKSLFRLAGWVAFCALVFFVIPFAYGYISCHFGDLLTFEEMME